MALHNGDRTLATDASATDASATNNIKGADSDLAGPQVCIFSYYLLLLFYLIVYLRIFIL